MIFATGSTYSQGDARPGLDGSRHGGRDRSGHHCRVDFCFHF